MFKTVIRLKDAVSNERLLFLTPVIENAFTNRAGSLRNVSDHPREFVFQGNRSDCSCLDLGMLTLAEQVGFLQYVQSWDWVDERPQECCSMLDVIARHPL